MKKTELGPPFPPPYKDIKAKDIILPRKVPSLARGSYAVSFLPRRLHHVVSNPCQIREERDFLHVLYYKSQCDDYLSRQNSRQLATYSRP